MHRIPTHLLFKLSVNKGQEENLLKERGLGAKRMDELGVILNRESCRPTLVESRVSPLIYINEKRTSDFFYSNRNSSLSASTQNSLSLICLAADNTSVFAESHRAVTLKY